MVEEEKFVSAQAQDSNVEGVPSISVGSFVMPVPQGKAWSVQVPADDVTSVEVRWFSVDTKISKN